MKWKPSRPTCQLWKKTESILRRYPSGTSQEIYLGSAQGNKTSLLWLDIFQRRGLKLRTINQAHIHNSNDPSREQQIPRFIVRRSALQLDIHNGNKWNEAIDLEIEQIKEYQVFTDVGNAYLQALKMEKLNIVGGPEFEELQGHVLVMYKALYGTRSGGACWHNKFFDILHHMVFKTSEVDWGGHDPNRNHVNEFLLSEVDWGAHNPDADDPEQLTGESIQSFLTFVVQLQLLVALGRLYLHKSLPCPSLW